MKVFVIHYKKLANRKLHILRQFKKHGINDYEFVQIDRNEVHTHDISVFKQYYDRSQIAISLSHFYAYKQISEKYECGLILEDDVILSDNFTEIFNKYLEQLPETYDMLFIGNGCKLHIEQDKLIPGVNIYRKCLYPTSWGGDGMSRCTDSYLVSKKCATQICKYIESLPHDTISLPIDWWINVAGRDNNFEVYWAEPTIATQGTQTGLFETSH